MNGQTPKPWYKEPWPWLLMSGPAIVVVAAFNLVSSLVMAVKEKQADIAILRTLGMSPGGIMRIFIVQGEDNGLVLESLEKRGIVEIASHPMDV